MMEITDARRAELMIHDAKQYHFILWVALVAAVAGTYGMVGGII
jgi:hypothetical protein